MSALVPDQSDPVLEYLAGGVPVGQARHLAVFLHGYGRDGHVMEKAAEACLDRIKDIRVVLPHGPQPADLLFEEGIKNPRQWFTLKGGRPQFRPRLHESAAMINAFIDRQITDLGISDENVALVGFSQGGAVATYAGFLRKQSLGCVVAHSSLFFGGETPVSTLPLLYIHGTEDEEFTNDEFAFSEKNLAEILSDLIVERVEGLGHRTSQISRKIVADYIAAQLGVKNA